MAPGLAAGFEIFPEHDVELVAEPHLYGLVVETVPADFERSIRSDLREQPHVRRAVFFHNKVHGTTAAG